MKKIVCFFAFLLLTASCKTSVHQLQADCSKLSKREIMNSATALLLDEGLLIKNNDLNLGLIHAESTPSYNVWVGGTMTSMWTIRVDDSSRVTATAKSILQMQNAFGATTGGSETYYNDDVHEDWTWYWTVRNGLERLCGNKIKFTTKKVNH